MDGIRYISTLIIISLSLLCTRHLSHSCSLSPVNSNNDNGQSPSDEFQLHKSKGVHYVKMWLHLKTSSTAVNRLSIKGNDTFDPALWVWASDEGKYLLRLPMDYTLFSIGLLSVHETSMNVTFTESEEGCLSQSSETEVWNTIALFLESVLSLNSTEISSGNQVICRSAYTFQHFLYKVGSSDNAADYEGVGLKCCSENTNSDGLSSSSMTCDTSYSEGWRLVWVGPLVILVWLYILLVLTIYRSVQEDSAKMTSGFLLFEKFINDLKEDIVTAIEKKGSDLTLARTPSDLLSFHEVVYIADAIGISKRKQMVLNSVTRILGVVLVTLLFYTYFGLSIYYYWTKKDVIVQLKDSKELYINIFGHLGWLFAKSGLSLKYYAIFEAIVTAIMPVLVVFNYSSANMYRKLKRMQLSKKLLSKGKHTNSTTTVQNEIIPEVNVILTEQQGRISGCYTKCTNSTAGRLVQVISFIILVLYIVCVGTVYVVYSAYFILLGLFVSADVLGTWLIPVMIFIYYLTVAFRPLLEYYKVIKQNLFTLVLEHREDVLIQQQRDMFIPRTLLNDFYQPRSRLRVLGTLQNIVFATAVLILLFLALLTIQYPSMNLNTSGSSILGVNFVLLLPFLLSALSGGKLSEHDLNILVFDLTQYIKSWESEKKPTKSKLTNKIGHSSSTNKQRHLKPASVATAGASIESLAIGGNNNGKTAGIALKVLTGELQGHSPNSTLNQTHKPLLEPIL